MNLVQLVMARQYRGAELFALHLSREFIRQGATVHYVSLYENRNTPSFTPEDVPFRDVINSAKPGLSWSRLRELARILRECDPDLVQANAGDTLKYAVLVKIIYGFRYKIIFRNASTVSRYMKFFTQKLFYSLIFKKTDLVLSVSEYTKSDLERLFPALRDRLRVIPNGIVLDSYSRLPEFSAAHFNVVHVGGFTFEKNHEGLLRIFALVKRSVPHARLWLIGDGPKKTFIQNMVVEQRINDVIFVGAVPRAIDYIHSADVMVLPSVLEGMPGVLLEAMYARTPVVAYAVGAIGEIVKRGETGWLVSAGEEHQFADAILRVKAERDETMLDKAQHWVIQEFSMPSIAQRFLAAYRRLIEGI